MEKLLAVSTMSTCGTSLGTSWCWDRAKRNTSYSWEPVGKRPPVGHRKHTTESFPGKTTVPALYWAQIQSVHSDLSQGNPSRSALGWLGEEIPAYFSADSWVFQTTEVRREKRKAQMQKRQWQGEADWTWAQAAPLLITCWWQTSEEKTDSSQTKHLKFSSNRNSDKLCVCAEPPDAQESSRSQKNRYKLKPDRNVCSAFPPDSPDAGSFAPSF